jgi:hypothetical protein
MVVSINERKLEERKQAALARSAASANELNRQISFGADDDTALALADKAHVDSVYGSDAKRDSRGNPIQQGIGSPGHETGNHFASILRYEGREAYERAVLEIQKRDPDRHAKLGLPKIVEKKA